MVNPIYRTKQWREVRQLVLARDGYSCQLRLPKCKGSARAVDHINPLEDGGAKFDPVNLRASCISCNTSARNTDLARRAKGLAPTGSPKMKAPLPDHPTQAQWKEKYGYDWPPPPGGFASE